MTETNLATVQPLAIPTRKPQDIRVVSDPIPVLDTARFEHMQRIASVMAHSNLVPDALCKQKVDNQLVALEPQEIISNCFLVVNQAVRWGMDPFAVAQCVSVVHGKLCYEGKLIAAVLEAKLGIDLEYEISGQGDAMKVVVRGAINGQPVVDSKGQPKAIEGTVSEWKTTGTGSPWAARGGGPRMLRYRGAREWSRVYAPGLMLGVYSPDEMEDLSEDSRAHRAKLVPSMEPDDGPPPPPPPAIPHQPVPLQPVDHPDPRTAAEAFLKWLDAELATLAEPDQFETIWNEKYSALIDELDPVSQEDAMGLYRSHERRLAAIASPPTSDAQATAPLGEAPPSGHQGGAVSLLDQLRAEIGKLTANPEATQWAAKNKGRIAALAPADRKVFDAEFLARQSFGTKPK